MIEDILDHLDVKEDEAEVYRLLLQAGPCSASFLSKKSDIKRPTLYNKLESLTAKGVVYRATKESGRLYGAETPEKLVQLFEKKIAALRLNQEKLEKIAPLLRAEAGASVLRPRMHFFEGTDSVWNAMEDFLSCRDIDSLNFWTTDMFPALSKDHFLYSNRERVRKNIRQKTIVASTEEVSVRRYPNLATGEKFKRELRIAPGHIAPAMSYWVYENKVLFLASRAEAYAYIVESVEMAELMALQFDTLWQISTPYTMREGEEQELEEFMNEEF